MGERERYNRKCDRVTQRAIERYRYNRKCDSDGAREREREREAEEIFVKRRHKNVA